MSRKETSGNSHGMSIVATKDFIRLILKDFLVSSRKCYETAIFSVLAKSLNGVSATAESGRMKLLTSRPPLAGFLSPI